VLDRMPQLRDSCYIFSEANDSMFERPGSGKSDEPAGKPE
jgi:hypothetical protein